MTNAVSLGQIVAGKAYADEPCLLCLKEIKATQAVYGHYLPRQFNSLSGDAADLEPRIWHVMHPTCFSEWCIEGIEDQTLPLPLRCREIGCTESLALPHDKLPWFLMENGNLTQEGQLFYKLISVCSGNASEAEVNRIRGLVHTEPAIVSAQDQEIIYSALGQESLDVESTATITDVAVEDETASDLTETPSAGESLENILLELPQLLFVYPEGTTECRNRIAKLDQITTVTLTKLREDDQLMFQLNEKIDKLEAVLDSLKTLAGNLATAKQLEDTNRTLETQNRLIKEDIERGTQRQQKLKRQFDELKALLDALDASEAAVLARPYKDAVLRAATSQNLPPSDSHGGSAIAVPETHKIDDLKSSLLDRSKTRNKN